MVLNEKLHNNRSVGRSRIRWEDVVQSDTLKILGIWDAGNEMGIEKSGGAF
jgi:hypothetical protein